MLKFKYSGKQPNTQLRDFLMSKVQLYLYLR